MSSFGLINVRDLELIKRCSLVIFFVTSFATINANATGVNDNARNIRNMVAYCKLYGYVRYFHPSDEAAQIDWDKFAIWGVNTIKNLPEAKLIDTFNSMFNPVAPTVELSNKPFPNNFKSKLIPLNNSGNLKTVYWQHSGVQGIDVSNPYKSARKYESSKDKLLSKSTKIGDYVSDKLGENLYCYVPISLYATDSITLPKSDIGKFRFLQNELSTIDLNDTSFN